MMYRYGHGMVQDDREVAEWFKKAARQGDEDAQKLLRELG